MLLTDNGIMKGMDLSIIVPVYNSAKWLKRCVESIQESIKNAGIKAEIILIDNNSADRSPHLIQMLQKQSPRLIVASTCKTQGAAAVRNYGATIARGKYIWFIDADDKISIGAIGKLLTTANKSDADIVMLGVERVYPDGHTDYLSAVCPKEDNYKSRFVRYGLGPFQVLIKKKWWQAHQFLFQEGIIHEDMGLMSALILFTDKYSCLDEQLYYYYQNAGSVLHKSSWDPHYLDIFPALESLYYIFRKERATSKYHDELEWFFVWNLLIDSAKDFGKFTEGRVGFQKSRRLLKKYFPNWRRNRFLKQKPLKLRLRVYLNYIKR